MEDHDEKQVKQTENRGGYHPRDEEPQKSFIGGIKDKVENVREKLKFTPTVKRSKKQTILEDEFNNQIGNIPVNHPYWSLPDKDE